MGALSDTFKWGPRPMHLMVLNLLVIYAILSSAKFVHIAQDGPPPHMFICVRHMGGATLITGNHY